METITVTAVNIGAEPIKETKTISFSALESYKKCEQYFNNKYIEKIKVEKTLEKPFLVGGWTHELIEEKLNNPSCDVKQVFSERLPGWLLDCKLEFNTSQLSNLMDLCFDLSELLYRASEHCNEVYKIRNSNGTVLKSPIDYPSTSFKQELARLRTYKYKSQLDLEASKQNSDLVELSICWLLSESLFLAELFKFPTWAERTIHTEYEFGTTNDNIVPLLQEDSVINDVSFLGYIDWIVKLNDGTVGIIDHKSSVKNPTHLDVIYHPQLNLYAYAYKVLFGSLPEVIGINHIRSGMITLAEPNERIVKETVEYYSHLYLESTKNPYIKRHPNDYQSPCIKKDYTSNKITATCPYLDKCWSNYKKLLSLSGNEV
jgi:hypothetical protein